MAGQNSVYTWSRDHRFLLIIHLDHTCWSLCSIAFKIYILYILYIISIWFRLHHKCSETAGDPHNANRGFFFAHMGWLMVR